MLKSSGCLHCNPWPAGPVVQMGSQPLQCWGHLGEPGHLSSKGLSELQSVVLKGPCWELNPGWDWDLVTVLFLDPVYFPVPAHVVHRSYVVMQRKSISCMYSGPVPPRVCIEKGWPSLRSGTVRGSDPIPDLTQDESTIPNAPSTSIQAGTQATYIHTSFWIVVLV